MSTISLTLEGTGVITILEQLVERFNDLSEPMDAIAAVMEGASEDALADQQSPVDGSPWPALSDNYLKRRPSRVGGQMLQATAGGLAASITADSGDFWAQIGSNKPYAAIHNFGGLPEMAPGPAAIPQREYLGISRDNETELLVILGDFLLES